MIASVPFGIIQLFLYIKKKEYFKDIKNIYFYFVWLIVIASIIISAPLLLKILNWILLQAGQTKYVDGIRLFGQDAPKFFLECINSNYIKNNIFYIVRILIPIISELIVLHMFIKFIMKNKNNIAEKLNSSAFFIFTFFIIFIPFISFTTFIREDVNTLAARISALLVPLLSAIIPMTVLFYCKNVFVTKYKYIMLSILFSIVILMRPPNFNYNSYVFSNIIDIPQDMELIDEELLKDFPILGKGFIPNNNKNELLSNLLYTVSMWLLGLSVIGLPIIFIMIFFKSFTLGFSVSSIFAKYGFKGIVGVFTYIIPSPIILSIFSLFLASYSIIISVKILKGAFTKQTINFKTFMGKYFFILLVSILLSILCALFDAFVTPSFTKLFTNLIK